MVLSGIVNAYQDVGSQHKRLSEEAAKSISELEGIVSQLEVAVKKLDERTKLLAWNVYYFIQISFSLCVVSSRVPVNCF